ncbi:hypothetical protein [Bradyrhizobium lablabi]|uniref:hypothetical protein n=1 Tax=Bradyrhizobium lablabi TaxID=722472 RepID=UPI000A8AAC28|nr:hypothetical protein [Bradyrhizobium lablabi]
MTGNAINPEGEALDLHELSAEELDSVSGGSPRQKENQEQLKAMTTFAQALQRAGMI